MWNYTPYFFQALRPRCVSEYSSETDEGTVLHFNSLLIWKLSSVLLIACRYWTMWLFPLDNMKRTIYHWRSCHFYLSWAECQYIQFLLSSTGWFIMVWTFSFYGSLWNWILGGNISTAHSNPSFPLRLWLLGQTT